MPPTFEELAQADPCARMAKDVLERKNHLLTEDQAHKAIMDFLEGVDFAMTVAHIRNKVKDIMLNHASTKQLRCLVNEGNGAFAYIMK